MKKLLFCIGLIFFLTSSVHAFNFALSLNQNIYHDNERFDDMQQLEFDIRHKDMALFCSYEKTYMRLMGLSAAEYGIFGVGIKRYLGRFQAFVGYYFVDVTTIYYGDDRYNEAIHRYLDDMFGSRLWECYEVRAGNAIGFGGIWQWGHLQMGFRFLRIPTKIIGWDGESEEEGHWHYIGPENLSCVFVGVNF